MCVVSVSSVIFSPTNHRDETIASHLLALLPVFGPLQTAPT
ncbi:MAG: hypothetical protein AB1444_13735 [Spirochaetota bacterium]